MAEKELTEAERLTQIRIEREKYYGDSYRNMQTLGMQITALIEQHYKISLPYPIPAHITDLIMVSVKMNRASNAYLQDNYDDGHNYLQMAQEHQQRWNAENEKSSLSEPQAASEQPSVKNCSNKGTKFLESGLTVQT